ncbi:hypothetical protein [Novosphingobium sp. CCH12-A3]|nr:hypothetical protein [Novosphingobium sp. CCH12-A3]
MPLNNVRDQRMDPGRAMREDHPIERQNLFAPAKTKALTNF